MKLICGPMATISHPAFRILVENFGGCDEYFTEMINAGSLLNLGPFEKYYIDPSPNPQKIVWQLTGREIQSMKKASEFLVKLPGIGIDINMGCSAPDIYRIGAGIGWMLKPIEETRKMVQEVHNVIFEYNNQNENKKRFSVKLRLGDDDFTDNSFFDFCDMLIENGVELLTLHPRTKKEKLIRPPRYDYCQKLCQRYKNQIEIYLNGNIKDFSSYQNAIKIAPNVSGIMISRASVSYPWIFQKIKDLENKNTMNSIKVDFLEIALRYIDNIEKYQPQEFWKTRLQRFFTYYCDNFLFSHYAKTQFLNAKNNDDLRNKINDFFVKCPNERLKEV